MLTPGFSSAVGLQQCSGPSAVQQGAVRSTAGSRSSAAAGRREQGAVSGHPLPQLHSE
jgi:hypothetical protein